MRLIKSSSLWVDDNGGLHISIQVALGHLMTHNLLLSVRWNIIISKMESLLQATNIGENLVSLQIWFNNSSIQVKLLISSRCYWQTQNKCSFIINSKYSIKIVRITVQAHWSIKDATYIIVIATVIYSLTSLYKYARKTSKTMTVPFKNNR